VIQSIISHMDKMIMDYGLHALHADHFCGEGISQKCALQELYTAVPKDIRNKETSFVSLISSADNFEALKC